MRHRLRSFAFILATSTVPTAAYAADVFVEPLSSTGLPEDARPAFQAAVEGSFDSAGHSAVKAGDAPFRARTTVTKDRSRYDMSVRIVTSPGNRTVANKSAQCQPCTLEQAEKELRLLVRTVSLNLTDAEETSAGADSPPAPPPKVAAPAPSPDPSVSAIVPRPQSTRSEPSSWYRAMRWTAIAPGVAGVISGVTIMNEALSRNDCGAHGFDRCPKDWSLGSAGLGIMLASEAFAVWNLLDLARDARRPDGRVTSTAGAWAGVATTAALGGASYLLIKNEGYGSDFGRYLGFANIPMAALAATTSIGVLVGGADRPVESATTVFVAPGMVGLGGKF